MASTTETGHAKNVANFEDMSNLRNSRRIFIFSVRDFGNSDRQVRN
jgi:hypothetical protein